MMRPLRTPGSGRRQAVTVDFAIGSQWKMIQLDEGIWYHRIWQFMPQERTQLSGCRCLAGVCDQIGHQPLVVRLLCPPHYDALAHRGMLRKRHLGFAWFNAE